MKVPFLSALAIVSGFLGGGLFIQGAPVAAIVALVVALFARCAAILLAGQIRADDILASTRRLDALLDEAHHG